MGQTPAYDRFSQSQSTDLLTPDNYNLQSQSSSLPFSQSQASHLTPCGQSKPTGERSINSRCGNCEEKGHTRKDPKCPKYHTAEESARREVCLLQTIFVEGTRKVSQNVVPFLNGFMTLLCNFQCDLWYFL